MESHQKNQRGPPTLLEHNKEIERNELDPNWPDQAW